MFDTAGNGQRDDSGWHPWDLFEAVEKNLFQSTLFMDFKTDIREEEDAYFLEAELPGFQKDEIIVTAQKEHLVIQAEHREAEESTAQSGSYIRRERCSSVLKRSFDLPDMDTRHIEAAYQDGLLKLVIPKKEADAFGTTVLEIR